MRLPSVQVPQAIATPGSVRLRLAAALLLLALPLVVAVWAFGNHAGRRERNNIDQRLSADLTLAKNSYVSQINAAQATAQKLAHSQKVARALASGPRAARRVQARYDNVVLIPGKKGAALPKDAAVQEATVAVGKRTIGRVVVVVPFDAGLAGKLSRNAQLGDKRRLGLVRERRLVLEHGGGDFHAQPPERIAETVQAGGSEYRALAIAIAGGKHRTDLVVLEPSSEVAAAADRARSRVFEVGFGFVGALLVMAYALAPALARSRVSRQQRDQAERVLAHVGDGIFLVDHDGIIRLWNPAAEAITDLRSSEVCDRSAHETIPGWEAIVALVPVASGLGDSQTTLKAETVPIEVAGREVWLSVVGVALDEGIVYAFRDVTHERRLENLRSQFVATISHELRTPLAALHGAALTLREHGQELRSETRDDLLDMIAVQSRRLADLVEEILVTGQLDAGSLSVVKESFDAEDLVRETVAAAQMRLGNETKIDVSIPPVLPKATGDPDRTRQVLLNLLDNAIKYSPQGGHVEIALAADDGQLRFVVRDEGLGIPLAEQERIFDKFYRLDPDQRRGIGGSGLGLYISRELVRLMDGRIWAESEPGEGTVLTFELSLAARPTTSV